MAEFIIPKDKPYQFTVRVVAKDSFLAQDLTDMDTATFELIDYNTSCLYDAPVAGVVQNDPLDGVLKFSLTDVYTGGLLTDRGPKVDGYYMKPTYQGVVTITFTDPLIENRVTIIQKVYVTPTGCA